MAKRAACNSDPRWTGVFIGDCSQHLKTGECPVIHGVDITFGGVPYVSKPLALISGDSTNGFYGYGLLDANGYVRGLEIINSGWHFVRAPSIIFSGQYKSGIFGSNQPYNCSGRPWDDVNCMCSGTAQILGHKVYNNVTKIPPQCSMVYSLYYTDWPTRVKRGEFPICTETDLLYAKTDNWGRCLTPNGVHSGLCVATFSDGWGSDCSEGTWQKSDNYCYVRGGLAPRPSCIGPWYGKFALCGPEIHQDWEETDEYLDVGVCKKRGFKNVVAMKPWHGEPPFTSQARCNDKSAGDLSYTEKYLSARGTWSYSMGWAAAGCLQCHSHGNASASLSINATVGRTNSRIIGSQSFHYSSLNAFFQYEPFCNGVLGLSQCEPPSFGDYYDHGITGDNGRIFNTCVSMVLPMAGLGTCVKTTLSVTDTNYTYHQTISRFEFRRHCHTPPPDYNCDPDLECCTYYDLSHDYVFHSSESVSVTLSNPYTYTQLNNDVNTLLNEWNLLDDVTYPWKVYESFQDMPKVTYCENGPTSPLAGLTCQMVTDCEHGKPMCNYSYSAYGATIAWNDCQPTPDWPSPPADWMSACSNQQKRINCSYSYSNECVGNCNQDGRVLGGPAAIGHLGSVDFFRENRRQVCCDCECQGNTNDLVYSWGKASSFYHITQWPGDRESRLMYYGAFSYINNDADVSSPCGSSNTYSLLVGGDTLVRAKWAEIIMMDKPSRNFRMPCGIGSSGDWTLINSQDSAMTGKSSTWYTGNCVAECKCGTINAGLPYECTACTGQKEEKERWPGFGASTSGCSTILGAVSGACVTTGATFAVSGGIFTGEVGDFVNGYFTLGSPSVVVASTFRIMEIPDSVHLTVSGVFPITNNHVSGWIDVAQNEDWFDNKPKGDYVVRFWDFPSFAVGTNGLGYSRTNVDPYLGEQTATQKCVAWASCDPSIALIVPPNSIEAATAAALGRNVSITEMATLVPQTWGARHHYIIQQWMTDPIWTPPSKPCCLVNPPDRSECQPPDDDGLFATTINHQWIEDDGTCMLTYDYYNWSYNGSVTLTRYHYYPTRPFVEARASALSPFNIPTGSCGYPTSIIADQTKACWSISELEAMSVADFNFIGGKYGYTLSPICEPPTAAHDYWGRLAPWLVATNQEACINATWPQTDTNPIIGYGEGV